MPKDVSARARANKAVKNVQTASSEILSLTKSISYIASELKKTADSLYMLREDVSVMSVKIKELEERL